MASSGSLPVTTSLLLDTLRDESSPEGWRAFTDRYWPVLVGFGIKLGLNEQDAQDAAQWTLTVFLNEFRAGNYRRERGRLSAFVIGIAKNRVLAIRRERSRRAAGVAPDSKLAVLADDATLTMVWEAERRRVLLEKALERLRESAATDAATVRAFELVALRGVEAHEAAAQCGLSVDQVYLAKHRCTKKLREIVEAMTAAWDQDA